MPIYKRTAIILAIIALCAAGGTAYGLWQKESGESLTVEKSLEQTETVPAAEIVVYIVGAVKNPGVVHLPADSRVIDAVERCGGTLPNADLERVNMAELLKDGQQITVPEKIAVPSVAENFGQETQGISAMKNSAKSSASAKISVPAGKVNINTADEAALVALPGVGPSTAKKIIDYRENFGAFEKIEDIKKVRGIGDAKFNKMKDLITI